MKQNSIIYTHFLAWVSLFFLSKKKKYVKKLLFSLLLLVNTPWMPWYAIKNFIIKFFCIFSSPHFFLHIFFAFRIEIILNLRVEIIKPESAKQFVQKINEIVVWNYDNFRSDLLFTINSLLLFLLLVLQLKETIYIQKRDIVVCTDILQSILCNWIWFAILLMPMLYILVLQTQ